MASDNDARGGPVFRPYRHEHVAPPAPVWPPDGQVAVRVRVPTRVKPWWLQRRFWASLGLSMLLGNALAITWQREVPLGGRPKGRISRAVSRLAGSVKRPAWGRRAFRNAKRR